MCNKNKFKLMLWTFIFTMITIGTVNTAGAKEYLLFDDFEYELADNTAPTAYSEAFSKNRLLQIDGSTYKSYVKEAEEKGSRAFYIETSNAVATGRTESCIDYRYLPTVTSGAVTCEFSILAPITDSDKAGARFTLPVNGQIPVLVHLDSDKNLIINNKAYTKWVGGKWYNIAVTLQLDTDVCDIYLNGIPLDTGVALASAPDGIDSVGGRVKAAALLDATGGKSCSNLVAYDDIRIYEGCYSSGEYEFENTDSATAFNGMKKLYVEDGVTPKSLAEGFGHQVTVYSDAGFGTVAEDVVNDGAYAAMVYPDGVCTYEIITPTVFSGMEASGFDTITAREAGQLFKNEVHPRIIIDKNNLSRIRVLKETDGVMKLLCAGIIKNAMSVLGQEPASYGADGDTALSAARTVRDRVYALGMAYLLTDDEKYAKRLWEEIYEAGSFPDWGHSVKYLATGEMTAAFGVAYDWLFDYWTEDERRYMENAIVSLGLTPALDAYTGRIKGISSSYNWPYNVGNWNAVCNGGTLMGASAIFESAPEIASVVCSNAVRGMGYMMNSFAPDGAWEEGCGYWSYMMRYLTTSLKTAEINFGTDFGLGDAQGFDNTIEFVRAVSGSVGMNNFHDVDYSEGAFSSNYLYYMADETGIRDYFTERTNQLYEIGNVSVYDIMFYNPDREYTNTKDITALDVYFKNAELVSIRKGFSKEDMYLSYHAGKTNFSHSHADDGSFVLDMLGERWALDLGPDSYSLPAYHGGRRFRYYRTRAEGHNTLVINPDSSAGQVTNSITYAQQPVVRGTKVYSIADLSEAYSDNASSVKRGFLLTDNRTRLVVRDEIALKKQSDVYWFMHTDAAITVKDSKTAILEKNGKRLYVRLVSDAESAVFSVMDAKPLPTSPNDSGQNPNEGVRKLVITANESGNVSFQVSFSADEEFSFSDTPLSEWDGIDTGVLLSEDFEAGIHSGAVIKGSAKVKGAFFGKKGKALALSGDSEVVFRVPENSYERVTLELSLTADQGSCVKSGGQTILKVNSEGGLELLGESVFELKNKLWYNIAVENEKDVSRLYVNGQYVADATGIELSDISLITSSAGSFDDLELYDGSYTEKEFGLEFLHSCYTVEDTAFVPEGITTAELLELVYGSVDAVVYSDLENELEADTADENATVVLRSDDGKIVKYYNVKEDYVHNELLTADIEKAKSLGKNKALAKGMFTGGISSTEIRGFNGTTAFTRVSEAGSGKNGVAYYIEKQSCANTDEMTFDFKFIPETESGTVTYELSVKAPAGNFANKDVVKVYLPYNGTYKRMIVFGENGTIGVNNKTVSEYKPGRWYNFVISFHIGTEYADFYLDGEWLGKNRLWSYHNSDKIDNVGGRFRISSQITGLENGQVYSGSTAFDDVRVYCGEYYPDKHKPQLSTNGGGISLKTSCSLDTLMSMLEGSRGEIKLFKNESFDAPDAEYVSDGQLLTVATDRIVKYFDVEAERGLSYDGTAVTAMVTEGAMLYLTDVDTNNLEAVKCYDAENGCTIPVSGFDEVFLWYKDTMVPVCEKLIFPKE